MQKHVNKFMKYLKANYPLPDHTEINVVLVPEREKLNGCYQGFNRIQKEIKLYLGERKPREVLKTLAHEYKHALQYAYEPEIFAERKRLGDYIVSLKAECEASQFSVRVYKEYKGIGEFK